MKKNFAWISNILSQGKHILTYFPSAFEVPHALKHGRFMSTDHMSTFLHLMFDNSNKCAVHMQGEAKQKLECP